MCLQQVSLAVWVGELTGCVFVTFIGAPGSSVADSLDGAYLGPFTGNPGSDAVQCVIDIIRWVSSSYFPYYTIVAVPIFSGIQIK